MKDWTIYSYNKDPINGVFPIEEIVLLSPEVTDRLNKKYDCDVTNNDDLVDYEEEHPDQKPFSVCIERGQILHREIYGDPEVYGGLDRTLTDELKVVNVKELLENYLLPDFMNGIGKI